MTQPGGKPIQQVTDYRADLTRIAGLFRLPASFRHEPDHRWSLLYPRLHVADHSA